MCKIETLSVYLTVLERKYSRLLDEHLDWDSRKKAIEVQQIANSEERDDVAKRMEKIKLELAYEKAIQGIEISSDPLVPSRLFALEEAEDPPRLIVYVLTNEDQNVYRYTSICGSGNVYIHKNELSVIEKTFGFFKSKEELIKFKSDALIQSLNELEPTGLIPQE